MSGVMAFGRFVGNEVADVAVSPPVTVLVDGATMIVVGSQDSEESVMVEMGTKLLPRLSEDTVVMLGRAAEEVVSSVVTGSVVSVSVAETVMLGGSEMVVGSSAVVVAASPEVMFGETVASVVVGKNEVLRPVGFRSEMVVLAVIGISLLTSPSVLVGVVPLLISDPLGEGVGVVLPVPGPVAEGSTLCTEDASVVEMMVVPVPGPVAEASIVDTVVGEGVTPVPGPVAEASIVDSVDAAEETPVPGPVADGSTVGPAVSVDETISDSVPLVEVGPARPLDRSDKILLMGRPAEVGVTIPVGAITMPELEAELAAELAPVGIRPVAVPVPEVSIEVAVVESAVDVGTVSSPVWVPEAVS